MDYDTFLNQLKSLINNDSIITPEEEYFRKLLFQVELHSSQKITAELLLTVFKKSFTSSKSVKFDENWNDIKEPELFYDLNNMSLKEDLDRTKNTIKFFISDLRRLGPKVLKDPYRELGKTSTSGSRWYNFDIVSMIYGWESFYNDGIEIDTANNNEYIYSWSDISNILLFGKGYE